jgi:hypothetical protein
MQNIVNIFLLLLFRNRQEMAALKTAAKKSNELNEQCYW